MLHNPQPKEFKEFNFLSSAFLHLTTSVHSVEFFAKLRMSIDSAPKAYIEQSHFRMVLPTHHEHEVASAVQQLQGSGQLAISEAVQS